MVEKSRRSAETLGLLDANGGVSRWHFHEHLVLLQPFFIKELSEGKYAIQTRKRSGLFFYTNRKG